MNGQPWGYGLKLGQSSSTVSAAAQGGSQSTPFTFKDAFKVDTAFLEELKANKLAQEKRKRAISGLSEGDDKLPDFVTFETAKPKRRRKR